MMGLHDFPKAVVGIVVAVLIVTALAVPVIADYSDSTYVTYNNSTTHLSKVVDANATIVYSAGTVTINGTAITGATTTEIFMSDTVYLDNVTSSGNIKFVSNGTAGGLGYVTGFTASVNASTKIVTVSNITYSEGHTGSTTSFTADAYSWAYILDSTGTYSVYRGDSTAVTLYVNSVSDVCGVAYASDNTYYGFSGETIKANGATTTATVDYDTAAITNIIGVVSTTYSTDATASGITVVVSDDSTRAPNAIIVPSKVVGEKTDEITARTMLNIIPLLLVVGIVIGAVSLITIKKRD